MHSNRPAYDTSRTPSLKRLSALRRPGWRLFGACLLLSLLFHFGILPLIVWALHRATPITFSAPEIVQVTRSSALRLEQRPRPLPAQPRHLVTPPKQVQRTQPRRVQQRQPVPQQPPPAHRELAHIEPNAHRPQPPKLPPQTNAAAGLQSQQEQFEKTIARLREQNNPVVSAARPIAHPAAPKQYKYDFSASIGTVGSGQGILEPVQSWHEDGYDYYYVRYWVEYPDGTTETGVVPWPLRYAPATDPFRLGIHHMPLPVPLPGYTLPPGTVMHPLIAYCFAHRDELSDCPIQHG